MDGCTKVDKIKYGESAKSDTIRKMIIAMSRDIRVLVIKLADRLHNMRTLHYLRPDKQSRIAQETLEIFAPLAHRLGMNAIKWELEDLSFGTLHPKIYDEIVRMVAEAAPSRDEFLSKVIEQVQADLRAAKIKASVTGRPKHYYSIYQKMIVRGRDFTDIFDLVGLRVLVESNRDCYAALGVLHVRWNPLPGRFKDYIAMPKFNMYQSLHTTVLGPEGSPVELQIRTDEMHRRAEYGVAAHWKYKEGKGTPLPAKGGDDAGDLVWVRQLLDWQRETDDPSEFLDSLRFEINSTEVYAFTPKGEVVSLPQGSTPIDFAYAIHTEVGHKTIGARVNGRLVPLESALTNGDLVEIFTSKAQNAGPSRDWLTFVRSPRARNKIRHYFTRERRDESVENGREALARQMRKGGLPLQRLLTLEHLTAVAGYFKLPDVTALYAAVGEGTVGAQAVVNRLITSRAARRWSPTRPAKTGSSPGVGGAAAVPAAGPSPASASSAPVICWSSWPSAVRRCRATRSWVSSPRAPGSRCTGYLRQRGQPAQGIRAADLGRVGADRQELFPGGDPGRSARPQPAAIRHHPGPVGPARQHLVGRSEHHQGPDLPGQVHLRDGRSDPSRSRPPSHPQRARRLRRLPHQPVIFATLRAAR